MANGSNSYPPSGGGFGGLGQPGVRETKVVGETSEIKIPRKQFLETWIFSFLILILGFACLKILITNRDDWALFIGILTIPATIAGYLFFERQIAYKFFPRVWAQFMAAIYRCWHTDDIGRFLLFALPVSMAALISVGFYITVIVPQMTLIFDQQAQYVFVFGAFISLFFAFIPYYKFNRRQLVDSLRDSDSHYATRALELESEERLRKELAMQTLLEAPVSEEPKSAFIQAVTMRKATAVPTAPTTDAQTRFVVAVYDFLDGIDNGSWTTAERTWRNDINGQKILPKSKFALYGAVGNMIRDELIRAGWARWKSPDQPQRGWVLLYSTQEIREEAFHDGRTINRPEDAAIAGDADTDDGEELDENVIDNG